MGDVHQNHEFEDSHVFDPIPKTPEDTDEGNGEEHLGLNVGREEGHDEEEEEDKLYRDTLTLVAPLPMSAPTITPSTIATITTTQQAPLPPTIAPSTLLQDLPNFGSLFGFDHRLKTLEANFSKFMQTNQFAGAVSAIPGITIDENMQKIIKEKVKEQVKVQVSKILPKIEQNVNEQLEAKVLTRSSSSSKTSYAIATDLSEMELKKILIEKMEGNKSIHRSNEQRNLYKDLVEAYESDKTGGPRDAKKERSLSQQALQRRQLPGALTTFEMEEPSHPEFETGGDDQPIVESSQHPEWFSQQQKPPTLDRYWNKTLPATYESIQPWISELAKQSDSVSSFNELMDTPVDFSAFLMNRLRVDTLTPEVLVGPTYKLMKGSCKSLVELEYQLEEVYKFYGFAVNRESARDVYSKRRIIAVTELKIVEWHNYKHLDWITVRRDDDKLYKFKEGDFKRLRIQDIEDISIIIQRRVEDLQLGVKSYQKKLNLTKPDTYHSDLKRKEAYIAYSNPRGFIYQNKDKKNRLMRVDELHRFSDEMLTDVRTALDDRLKGIRMQYLPRSIWRKSDKDKAAAMIQAID
nr:hypothetical protein [Tanacetum cinerariifolium]